jgi:hypothetical protein
MPSYRKVSELQSFTVNASRLHSRKSRVEARRDVTARGIPGLSPDAPELALELFNLVRATPRAVNGQLESTRRATSLALAFQLASCHTSSPPAAHLCSQCGIADVRERRRTPATETKTETKRISGCFESTRTETTIATCRTRFACPGDHLEQALFD